MEHGKYSAYANGRCRCSKCRGAWAAYKRDYKKRVAACKHPDGIRAARQAAHQRGRAFLDEAKLGPCLRCGVHPEAPCMMDLHHRSRETKRGSWASILRLSLDALRAEVAKCDRLCANCHRLVEFAGATY